MAADSGEDDELRLVKGAGISGLQIDDGDYETSFLV